MASRDLFFRSMSKAARLASWFPVLLERSERNSEVIFLSARRNVTLSLKMSSGVMPAARSFSITLRVSSSIMEAFLVGSFSASMALRAALDGLVIISMRKLR